MPEESIESEIDKLTDQQREDYEAAKKLITRDWNLIPNIKL